MVGALSWGASFNYPLVGYVGAAVAFGVTIFEFLKIRTIEQGVTDKRVIHKIGIISRKSEEMKHPSIETVEIDQSIVGRLMGFGTVSVTGRGVSDVIFKGIDDPLDVKRRIEGATIEPEPEEDDDETDQSERKD